MLNEYLEKYYLRAWHAECRVFVDQTEDTILSCRECISVSFQMKRRIQVFGLKDSTVRINPEPGFGENTEVL